MEVARATSSPMRSSIRRSTPAMGDGVQSSLAAWTAARWEKSAFSFMGVLPFRRVRCRDARMGIANAQPVVHAVYPSLARIDAPPYALRPHHVRENLGLPRRGGR